MTRRLAVSISWQFDMKREDAIALAKIADEIGCRFVLGAGRLGARRVLAADFDRGEDEADQARDGHRQRLLAHARGAGAALRHAGRLERRPGDHRPGRVERERHRAVPRRAVSSQSMARIRETVDIINMLMRGEKLVYHGKWFNMDKGFTLRFPPVRPHIPIYIAALNPKSVKQTAEIADGWMPVMIPLSALKDEVDNFRAAAAAAGRDPMAITVKSPGGVTVSSKPGAQDAGRGFLAFYIARMGTFYYNQLSRLGFGDEWPRGEARFRRARLGGRCGGAFARTAERIGCNG